MTLSELLYNVKHVLDNAFQSGYWIVGEVVNLDTTDAGAWYLEFGTSGKWLGGSKVR